MRWALLACMLLALGVNPGIVRAQLSGLTTLGNNPSPTRNEPVTFAADQVEYDRENALVIARGHVEAWQNDHVLRADEITFDRNTGTAAAKGNVVLLEPDGEVMFADYAEMTQNMREGVLKDMRALLAQNGKLAANGARRTAGELNELSRVVYSACDLCKDNPSRAPLWQIRAFSAVQDLEHKRIEYEDAVLQMYGVPVAYFPYLSAPDPSVKRASGLLMPLVGTSSHLGAFIGIPYFWAINGESDATFTPILTSRAGPQLAGEYRHRFNSGFVTLNGSAGYLNGSPQGYMDAKGQFSYNDTWRMGFDVNRVSSNDYVRAIHIGDIYQGQPNVLVSQLYAEGFGQGAYSRLDSRFYQGLLGNVATSTLPLVLPRYTYSYFGTPDRWGGRLSLEANAFNVYRTAGTRTQRGALTVNWERPFEGAVGDLWKITLHTDAAAYNANHFNEEPNFGTQPTVSTARALPQAAIDFRWPFMRDSGSWGTQVIEPLAELIIAPRSGDSQLNKYPNEDSFDLEFTDANLFGFNRFPGIDRLEGGARLNAALHGTWYLGGTTFNGLIGQSYRTFTDSLFPFWTGLHDPVSDVVARASFTPAPWLDLTYRTRLDKSSFATRFADVVASVGVPKFRVSTGYIYTNVDPYYLYNQPLPPPASSPFFTARNEITLGATSNWGRYRFSAVARRDLANNQMVSVGGDAAYEDECFILDLKLYRRYTSFNGDSGSTAVLLQFTLKTIGQFGYRLL